MISTLHRKGVRGILIQGFRSARPDRRPRCSGCGVFRFEGLGFRLWGLTFRVEVYKRVWDGRFRALGVRFKLRAYGLLDLKPNLLNPILRWACKA